MNVTVAVERQVNPTGNNEIMMRLFDNKQIICPVGEPDFDVRLKRAVRRALDQAQATGRRETLEECIKDIEPFMNTQTLKLAAGEMSAQEVRTVKAIVSAIIVFIQEKMRSSPDGK